MSITSSCCHPKCCAKTVWQAFLGLSSLLASAKKFFFSWRGWTLSSCLDVVLCLICLVCLSQSWPPPPRAQGHAVYLSLCLCVLCVHSGLICLHKICLSPLTCLHSYCSFRSAQLSLPARTHSPGCRNPLEATPGDTSLSWSAVFPLPVFSLSAPLSLFMSKWHSNYNSLMSRIFGMHGTVCPFRPLCIPEI